MKKKMRLLHVFPELGGGGTEDVILKISNYLLNQYKCEVGICAETSSGLRKHLFEKSNIRLINASNLSNKKKIIKNIISISRAVKKFKPEIIHTHSIYSLFIVFLVKTIFNKRFKIVHTGHGGPKKDYDEVASKFLWMSDVYVAISKYSYDFLMTQCKKRNIKLIYNGTDKPLEETLVKTSELSSMNQFNIGFIGRLTQQKGLYVLIDAINYLSKKGYNINVIIVGHGEEEAQVRKVIKDKELEDMFSFTGFVNSPWEEVVMCPIIVMPSLWEPGGLVAIEGIVRNHTVVASDVQGLKETIIDGENGFLFETGNAEQLAKILEEIYIEKKYFNFNSTEREKYFFENRTGPIYLEIYKNLIGKI